MITSPIDWQWGAIDARATDAGLCLTHRGDGASLWVREGRLVRGTGYQGAGRAARRELARVGAVVRLRERGRYLIHASGVVDPRGRAWLLSGDSGSGKSTLAYALARAGWRVLGDDGVVVGIEANEVRAYPWRAPLMVSVALAPAFPEIGRQARAADPADPRRRTPLVAPRGERSQVAALLFVHRTDSLSVRPLGTVDALAALVRQSPWVILRDSHAASHLAALRRIASLPAFRLGHTPAELHGIAAVLAGALP